MDKQKAQDLINKYLEGKCTPSEKLLVEQWYNLQIDDAESLSHPEDLEAVGQEILEKLSLKKKRNRFYFRYAAAAVVLIALGIGGYYQPLKNLLMSDSLQIVEVDILPGGDKAFLTLGNGERISLTDAAKGDIDNDAGITITKTADGQIIYSLEESKEDLNSFSYNTISTPKGGQFQVRLPDGSDIWLNSESSLRYPTSFSTLKERKVELKGEAYFEIAHNKEKPFIVQAISHEGEGRTQEVEVLGTHFNINSYDDENVTKTTLLEGSVRVKTSGTEVVLRPNQQSKLKDGGFSVISVNPEEAISWKNGYFMFEDEGIESIMRKVARWYNVEVEFKRKNKDQVFTGTISKFESVSKVLSKLELTGGVHFKIEGRRVVVD